MKYTTLIIAAVGLTNAIALPKEPLSGSNNLAARSIPRAARQPGFVTVKKRSSDDPSGSKLPDNKGKGREVEDKTLTALREQEEAYTTDSSSGSSRGGTNTPPTSDEGTRSPSPVGMQPWQPDPNDPGSPTIPEFSNSENLREEDDPYGWNAHADQVQQQREQEERQRASDRDTTNSPFREGPSYDVFREE
ncbi:hypothetical protein B0T21DRAFT_454613 [Apiosordaria backusii]|uniref:Uncharacterized protein n=1 Tax=Apiosordaria backusii TaxID=314023 RepID=A0AA40DSY8_9PEZI|nr:hypothetical protein B0T21DRAFT_454613 [Apiosordaria backusii]